MVDAVEDDLALVGAQATPNQLVTDLARHRHHERQPGQEPLVERVVHVALTRAVPGPAVRGGHHRRAVETPEQPYQQIGLVVVGVDDVDAAFANDTAQGRQHGDVERVLFGDLEVLDPEAGRAFVNPEHPVADVPDVADGDVPG